MASPSHYREFSFVDQQRVRSLLLACENFVNSARGDAAYDCPIAALEDLLTAVTLDLAVCGGAVKTTRIVSTIRDVLEMALTIEDGDNRTKVLQLALDVLCCLVKTSHSRRSFADVLPSHGHLLMKLLRDDTTTTRACDIMVHVLLFTQEAKDILERLANDDFFFEVVEHIAKMESVESNRSCVNIISAILCVTPRVENSTLHRVIAVAQDVLIKRAPAWPHDMFERLVHLLALASIEGFKHPDETMLTIHQWLQTGAVPIWYTQIMSFVSEEPASGTFEYTVKRFQGHLSVIRKNNLDPKVVLEALSAMFADIQELEENTPLAVFAVGFLPGGVKTLCGTLSTVDEAVSSLSCAILTQVLGGLWEFPNPLEDPRFQFVALDGILLLSDMLDDYSDDVVTGAFSVLRALSDFQPAMREITAFGVGQKVINHLTSIPSRFLDTNEKCTLLPLAALCCELVCTLSPELLSAVCRSDLLLRWAQLLHGQNAGMLTIPFLRLCTRVSEVAPEVLQSTLCDGSDHLWLLKSLQDVPSEMRVLAHGVWLQLVELLLPSSPHEFVAQLLEATFVMVSPFPHLLSQFWSWVRCVVKPALRSVLEPLLIHCFYDEVGKTTLALEAVLSVMAIWIPSVEVLRRIGTRVIDVADHKERLAAVRVFGAFLSSDLDEEGLEFSRELPLILTRLIALCEDSPDDDEMCSQVSTECFALLLHAPSSSVASLLAAGNVVIECFRPNAPFTETHVGWLGTAFDRDDAHDLLVVIVPLLNGLLNKCPESRCSDPMLSISFFFRLLSFGEVEIPLRMLGIYGLWLTLSPDSDTEIESIGEVLLSWNVFTALSHFMREAHTDACQSSEALQEIRQGCFLLADRLQLLTRSLNDQQAFDISQFVANNIIDRDSVPLEGCPFLLSFLQSESRRAQLAAHPRYAPALTQLRSKIEAEFHESTPSGAQMPSAYYALLQIDKYLAELPS